jgi:hypothetical protein
MNNKRPSPNESATLYKIGTKKSGNDGNKWIITENINGVKRWKLYKKQTSKKVSSKKPTLKKPTTKKPTLKKPTLKKVKETPYYPQIYIYIEFKYDNIDERNVLVNYFTKNIKKYKLVYEYNKNHMMVDIYKFYDKKIISEIKKFLKTTKIIKSFNIHRSYQDENGEIQELDI